MKVKKEKKEKQSPRIWIWIWIHNLQRFRLVPLPISDIQCPQEYFSGIGHVFKLLQYGLWRSACFKGSQYGLKWSPIEWSARSGQLLYLWTQPEGFPGSIRGYMPHYMQGDLAQWQAWGSKVSSLGKFFWATAKFKSTAAVPGWFVIRLILWTTDRICLFIINKFRLG